VLFLCTGNSARSQIAEAILRDIGGNRFDAKSAGTNPRDAVNEFALAALRERGIDYTGLYPKNVSELSGEKFDIIVTLCDHAREDCPAVLRRCLHLHWSLDDPAALKGTYYEIMVKFRETCNEIEKRIRRNILQEKLPSTS